MVVKEGAALDGEELVRFCEGRLSYFAIPRFVEFRCRSAAHRKRQGAEIQVARARPVCTDMGPRGGGHQAEAIIGLNESRACELSIAKAVTYIPMVLWVPAFAGTTDDVRVDMAISWFCQWDAKDGQSPVLDEHDHQGLVALIRGCPRLVEGHVMTPVHAHDPHYAAELHTSPAARAAA